MIIENILEPVAKENGDEWDNSMLVYSQYEGVLTSGYGF